MTPPTPCLSAPILFTASALESSPAITSEIAKLGNEAFSRSKRQDPEKWNAEGLRFPTTESYYDMLGDTGKSVVALIFDADSGKDQETDGLEVNGAQGAVKRWTGKKVVACAAAVPWKGGWEREGAGREDGWEIKAVCVSGDARYLKTGLAVKVLTFLENYLVEDATVQQQRGGSMGGFVSLWILAAECLNGVYWRKRGYHNVRSSVQKAGVWSCRTSFEMVVLRKDLPIGAVDEVIP